MVGKWIWDNIILDNIDPIYTHLATMLSSAGQTQYVRPVLDSSVAGSHALLEIITEIWVYPREVNGTE